MISRDLYQFRHMFSAPGERVKIDYWKSYYLDEEECKRLLTEWVREFEKYNPQLLSSLSIEYHCGIARVVYYRERKRYEESLQYGPYRIYLEEGIFDGSKIEL